MPKKRQRRLALVGVRHAHHRRFGHAGIGVEHLFYFPGVDVIARGDDQLALSLPAMNR